MALYVLSLVSMFSGVIMYVGAVNVIKLISSYRRSKNFPSLETLSDQYLEMNITCKPHFWERITLAMRGLDPGKYIVCSSCGLVSGTHFRLNGPGLEVFKNSLKLNADNLLKDQREENRIQEILNRDFDLWTKTFIHQFGKDPDKNLKLLEEFSEFMIESSIAATKRAADERENG